LDGSYTGGCADGAFETPNFFCRFPLLYLKAGGKLSLNLVARTFHRSILDIIIHTLSVLFSFLFLYFCTWQRARTLKPLTPPTNTPPLSPPRSLLNSLPTRRLCGLYPPDQQETRVWNSSPLAEVYKAKTGPAAIPSPFSPQPNQAPLVLAHPFLHFPLLAHLPAKKSFFPLSNFAYTVRLVGDFLLLPVAA